jgi:hypothetical protein
MSAWETLAFNVDDNTTTFVELPRTGQPISELMEVWGRLLWKMAFRSFYHVRPG